MVDFITNCILWTLALYGFIDILKIIVDSFKNKRIENNGIYLIIGIKNQELQVEGFFRSVILKFLHEKDKYVKNVIITDLNSIDNTKQILEKLAEDYDEVKVADWDVCKQILDSIEL